MQCVILACKHKLVLVCEIVLWLGFSDQFSHAKIIQRHYVFLVDKLVAKDSGLVGELYRDEVLTSADMESICAETTSSEQNKKLLTVLSRKTKVQFDQFLDALDKTGQQHVRNEISAETKCVSYYKCVSLSYYSTTTTTCF